MKSLVFVLLLSMPMYSFADPLSLPVQACVIQSIDRSFESMELNVGQYFLIDLNQNEITQLDLHAKTDSSIQTVVFDQALRLSRGETTSSSRTYRGFNYIDKIILNISSMNWDSGVGELDEIGWRPSAGVHGKASLACRAIAP